MSQTADALTTAREIVRRSGLWADIFTGNTVEDKSRQENMQELMNAISDFVDTRREEGDSNDKLIDYINSVQLLTDQDTEGEGSDDHITLMTVHSAKGLEFPAVFVVGLEEELFPNQLAQNSLSELEEERRLLYVAITRAQDYCMLTFAKSRYRYGAFAFCEPSRFLKEIDRRYINFKGSQPEQRPQQQPTQRTGLFAATNERRGYVRSDYSLDVIRGESAEGNTPPPMHQRIVPPSRLQRVSDAVRQAPSPGASPGASQVLFGVGDIVSHERFGMGEVLSLEGAGENAKAKIRFRHAGEKTLLLKFAKLTVVK